MTLFYQEYPLGWVIRWFSSTKIYKKERHWDHFNTRIKKKEEKVFIFIALILTLIIVITVDIENRFL